MNQDLTFIFDFDGTLADTHHMVVQISNQLAEEFGYNHIPDDEIENLKNKAAHELVYYLNVPILKVPAIIARGKKLLRENMHKIEPIEGMTEGLRALRETGAHLGIVSSNSQENIDHFIQKHRLNFFDFIYTTSKVWSKNTYLKKVLSVHDIKKENVIYVGDEERDVKAAKKLGIRVAAVTWGYNSEETLKKSNPDYLIRQPGQLTSILRKKS